MFWRRREDSNLRYGCPYTPLAGERFRPLSHFSVVGDCFACFVSSKLETSRLRITSSSLQNPRFASDFVGALFLRQMLRLLRFLLCRKTSLLRITSSSLQNPRFASDFVGALFLGQMLRLLRFLLCRKASLLRITSSSLQNPRSVSILWSVISCGISTKNSNKSKNKRRWRV